MRTSSRIEHRLIDCMLKHGLVKDKQKESKVFRPCSAQLLNKLTNLSATGETGTFYHGKHGSCDVAVNDGTLVEVATAAAHITIDMAINVNLTGFDVALNVSQFADGHLAGLGENLAVNLAIDVHVILESDGTDNLDSLSQNICRIRTHVGICF